MARADVESFQVGNDSWAFAVGASSAYKGLAIFIGLRCINVSRELSEGAGTAPLASNTLDSGSTVPRP